jgi:hypothetical protein
MFKRRTLSRWIGLLAALWLVGQLAAAFHLGHHEAEGIGGAEHSCVMCKLVAADDVLTTSPTLPVFVAFLFAATLVPVLLVARQQQWHYQSRAPPAS